MSDLPLQIDLSVVLPSLAIWHPVSHSHRTRTSKKERNWHTTYHSVDRHEIDWFAYWFRHGCGRHPSETKHAHGVSDFLWLCCYEAGKETPAKCPCGHLASDELGSEKFPSASLRRPLTFALVFKASYSSSSCEQIVSRYKYIV
jgi:hypothetical protein